MKIKRIKDNDLVVDGKEYAKLVRFNHDFWSMQGALHCGYKPYYFSSYDESGFYTVSMVLMEFYIDIKRFASDDAEYNKVCAKELVELLNQEQ